MSTGYNIKRAFEAKTLKITANIVIIVIVGVITLSGAYNLYRFFFPKKQRMTNNPKVTALPFSKIEKIDQTSTQILLEEKSWELGMGAGGLNYDNKAGSIVGLWVKRKW